jgi:NtrC-family two-component system response regulator AlgB
MIEEKRLLSILIVDDELNIRKTLGLCLESEAHSVRGVSNQQDALNLAGETRFDLVFLDIRLGVDNGIEVLPKLLSLCPWLKVIMITAYATIDSAVEAMKRGAFDFIAKPFSVPQVLACVSKVCEIRKLEDKVSTLQEELHKGRSETEIKSHSTFMQRAIELAKEVASSEATVLISGESGTGKGVLAKAIHGWSPRSASPFGVISCPSLSPELLESELFGHAKGAFTGAVRQNLGRIAGCNGGTLFLDEIGDLPLPLQPKLLRFIQDREYEAVGDNTTRRADVRVIAASNVNFREAVKSGRFREDLFYRLNVIQIEIPPLRDRSEDIPLLAGRFLAEFSQRKKIVGFTEDALAKLQKYSWPGNIRELRNVIERAAILCHSEWVETKHLTLIEESAANRERAGDLLTLEKVEESHIRRVLSLARSLEEAAQILGIDTATLWRRRKKYGI